MRHYGEVQLTAVEVGNTIQLASGGIVGVTVQGDVARLQLQVVDPASGVVIEVDRQAIGPGDLGQRLVCIVNISRISVSHARYRRRFVRRRDPVRCI